MIDGICRANNKHPSEDEARRVYFKPGEKLQWRFVRPSEAGVFETGH